MPRGRPKKYGEYETLLNSLPKPMKKRPKYVHGIGIFRGARGDVAWIKIRLPHGGVHKGKSYPAGSSLGIKLGNLSSWSWQDLENKLQEMQERADKGEPLEQVPDCLFQDWAQDYLDRAKTRVEDFGSLEIHVRKHLNPTFGRKALNIITRSDINTWQSKQLETLAPATVKRQLNTFKAIINDAVHSGLIKETPTRQVSLHAVR